jgi:pimeloyl-ACP methyl ester carboxylesterase
MEKLFIKNRDHKNIAVILDKPENVKGLAFIMHGLGATKDRDYLNRWAKIFRDRGYLVVRFDARDTYGESEGHYENATVTSYYQDLEDVINWTKAQDFYKEPFVLMGHSFGGICTALYAEYHVEEVKALAPIATVVSGSLSMQAYDPKVLADWEATGWNERPSPVIPGLIKRLPWSHMIDRQQYDLLPEANKLTMPVLMMVGSEDTITPAAHQQILFDALPGPKEFHIILNGPHTFRDDEHIEETCKLLDAWLQKLEK